MSPLPPPPPGGFSGPPPGESLSDEERKRLKSRDGEENRKVLKWVIQTGKPFLPSIIILMVFSAINSVAGVVFALVSQHTIDSAVDGNMKLLIIFAVLLAVVGVAQILLRALSNYWTEKVSALVENGYRSRMFDYILDRDFQQLSAYHSGDLMNRLTDDVNIIVSGVTTFLPSIAEIIASLVGAGSVLLIMDWRFLLVYILATVALIVITRYFRHAIKKLSAKVREADGKTRSFYQDSIGSLLVLRVFVTEKHAKEQSSELLNNFYKTRLTRSWVRIKSNAAMGFSMNFGHIFSLIWCSVRLALGDISYGSVMAITQLSGQVRQPFISASNLATQYYSMIASGERLMEIEALQPELTEEERARRDEGFDARGLYNTMEKLNIANVTFGYRGEKTLDDVNFEIEKGDCVAIMGQSGCGKSTLFKLILGVLRGYEGSLSVSGTDENGEAWSEELGPLTRRLFAYVPQGNLLVSGRLRDNLAFTDQNVSDEEIWEACRIACADEYLRQLPDGLDTIIGERGGGLSEGQVQRIAVARAYLSGAPILLLDEATSALDDETEAQLLRNLQSLKDRTCLIVTHRKAALKICNKTCTLQRDMAFDASASEPPRPQTPQPPFEARPRRDRWSEGRPSRRTGTHRPPRYC